MREQQLSQRQLASLLDVSQGHLSKVLRGNFERDTRAFTALTAWVMSPASAVEMSLVTAARRAAGGRKKGLEILMHMMHLMADLHGERATEKKTRRKTRRA